VCRRPAEGARRLHGILEVSAGDVLALGDDLTDLPGGDWPALLVEHAQRDAGDPLSDACGARVHFGRRQDREPGRRFGGAVHDVQAHARLRLAQLAHERRLQLSPRLLEPFQVRELDFLEARLAQQ